MQKIAIDCQRKYTILGVRVNQIDYQAAVSCVINSAKYQRPLTLTALAVHGVMTGALNREHRARLNAIDIVAPDGQPVRWALNALYNTRLDDRVYGPELMLQVCAVAAANELPIFLYGSHGVVLERLRDNLQRQFDGLQVAGIQKSRFRTLSPTEKQADIVAIQTSGARIVFVGLGCPRQETWIYEHRNQLNIPMLAVGAAFDFHAGLRKQAPRWMQRRGLGWLFRLIKEPRRLWRRYIYLNPLYIMLIFLQWSGLYSIRSDDLPTPIQEIRYG